MSIESLTNIPHGWIIPASWATLGLFSLALMLAAVFRADNRSISVFSILAALFVSTIGLTIAGPVEGHRFSEDNRGTIADWLDASYGFEASRDDLATIARIVAGQASEEEFTFGSDKGPVIAKVVEGPDGTFGLVSVAEPVKTLD